MHFGSKLPLVRGADATLEKNAFIYDNKCNEIGNSTGIQSGTSITSQLPYIVEIEFYETGGIIGTGADKTLRLRFSYAGQIKGEWKDDKGRVGMLFHN